MLQRLMVQLNDEEPRGKKRKVGLSDKLGDRRRTAVFTRGQAQASDSVSHEAEKSVRCHRSLCLTTGCKVLAEPQRHAGKKGSREISSGGDAPNRILSDRRGK